MTQLMSAKDNPKEALAGQGKFVTSTLILPDKPPATLTATEFFKSLKLLITVKPSRLVIAFGSIGDLLLGFGVVVWSLLDDRSTVFV